MTTSNLGRLYQVELREVWQSEPQGFTPWLAGCENLGLLGDAIGIDLECEGREKDIGPYRADILCKDTATNTWVLIENQLEKTDHVHLGQVLTYAAGLKAVTIVWVAKRFTDEHRAALDWLNENTGDDISFFGLEIELWRIGDSPIAPKFNVVSKPNDWTKPSGAAGFAKSDLTEAKAMQLDFWTQFREYLLEHSKRIKPKKPLPQNWMPLALGRTDAQLNAVASMWDSSGSGYDGNELRVELDLNGRNTAKRWFHLLKQQRAEVERELAETATWYDNPERNGCRIYLRQSADFLDRAKWPEYHAWLLDRLERMHIVFAERVKALPS